MHIFTETDLLLAYFYVIASEAAGEVLSKNDSFLCKENTSLTATIQQKEKDIGALQSEILELFNAEKREHKTLYTDIVKSLDYTLALKKDYDAVKLSGMLDNIHAQSIQEE